MTKKQITSNKQSAAQCENEPNHVCEHTQPY